MDNLNKSFLVRGNSIVGAVGDKNFSTLHVGCVIPFAGSTDNIPRGYLLADGASYPTAEYPDLYAVIGNTYGGDSTNFNVPDYRETVLVGVGQNTTDTIASHDVYELGEFKDDQMQTHTHSVTIPDSVYQYTPTFAGGPGPNSKTTAGTSNNSGRSGTTTHGKQKGVTYIIKAFHTNEGVDSGVSDDVIEYVDNKVEETIDFSSPVYEFNTGSDYTTEVNFEYTTSCKCIILCSITGVPYERVEIDRNAIGRVETNGITLCSVAATGDNSFGMGNSCIVSKGITLSVLLRPRYMQPLNFKVFKIG